MERVEPESEPDEWNERVSYRPKKPFFRRFWAQNYGGS